MQCDALGVVFPLITLLLMPSSPSAAQVVLAAGLAIALIRLLSRVFPGRTDGSDQAREGLERRIEELKDLAWELKDKEARTRELMDSLGTVIYRCDKRGQLTFVNRAFCRVFGVDANDVLGTEFTPNLLVEEPAVDHRADGSCASRRLQVDTTAGPRWYLFEQQAVPGEGHGSGLAADEIQLCGRDVTDQRAFQVELANARDQALSADRAKSRFLAAMSHEIRTPMNGILGMAGLLLDSGLTLEQRCYTEAIDQSARTLLLLIDEILDFSKIEAGKLAINDRPFSLYQCAQATIELLAPAAAEKGLELAWTIDPTLPSQLSGDEARIRQILLNLIGNALKFTDHGGVLVKVSGARQTSETLLAAIEVEDTGIGLNAEAKEQIFVEFGQGDPEQDQRRGGTGLGLAISRRLARAMGGDIEVVSEPGQGATFTATINLRTVADAAAHTTALPLVEHAGSVLLVVDRPIERRALAANLNALGLKAIACPNQSDAEQLTNAAANTDKPVDVVMVDCTLEVARAGNILAYAMARRPDRKVGGVVLIEHHEKSYLKPFGERGFQAHLVRPVRPLTILSRLGFGGPHTAPAQLQHAEAMGLVDLTRYGSVNSLVLLAEDNDVNALLARRMLEKVGCKVIHVRDGEQAVEAVKQSFEPMQRPYDIVLMDLHMPRLDGLEATAAIRRLTDEDPSRLAKVPPIVALTANAFAEDRRRCLAAGLDDYLSKPFQKDELTALLERWQARRYGVDRDGVTAAWSPSPATPPKRRRVAATHGAN